MEQRFCLNDIQIGQEAVVKELKTKGAMRRRLQDIGLVEGTKVTCVGCSPCGEPRAYSIRGAVIALRMEDCSTILVRKQEGAYGSEQ